MKYGLGKSRTGKARPAAEPEIPTVENLPWRIEMPTVEGHPNRREFEGCLTLVDRPSDKSPSGARGHRVVLSREAATAGLPSLLGMAVGFRGTWDGHDARQKCGIITAAEICDTRMMVRGFIFAKDFPEFADCGHRDLGMSYELSDAHVADMRQEIWTLTRATFTGAAILEREKAAYRGTSFRMVDAEPGERRKRSLTLGARLGGEGNGPDARDCDAGGLFHLLGGSGRDASAD